MNRTLIYILNIFILIFLLISCDKEDVMRYDRNRPGIEFKGNSSAYSFKKTSREVDTVSIPFTIVGYPEDRERHAQFVVVADSTTATEANYRIIDAVVKASEYNGNLRVRVENKSGDNFPDMRVYFNITDGEDFIPGMDINKSYSLLLTNKLVRPASWKAWQEKSMLGNYSTAYYQFIIEITGETEFPYPSGVPGYNDGKAWSNAYVTAMLDRLTEELVVRNKREGSPLLHDDGSAKDKEVVIGKYYQN